MSSSTIEWMTTEAGEYKAIVPIILGSGRVSQYEIYIAKRPHYCDRGDWLLIVGGSAIDLDEADGFPRYFFGSAEQAKQQMETWVTRRQAYRLFKTHKHEFKADGGPCSICGKNWGQLHE